MNTETPPKLLRIRDVMGRVGLSRPQIYVLMRRGAFPRPVKLSARAVAWPASDVDAWIAERTAERDGPSLHAA